MHNDNDNSFDMKIISWSKITLTVITENRPTTIDAEN